MEKNAQTAWLAFTAKGDVSSYLAYKQAEREEKNAEDPAGSSPAGGDKKGFQ